MLALSTHSEAEALVGEALVAGGDGGPIFEHDSFRDCMAELAVSRLSNRAGLALLTGQEGTGKTAMLGRLLAEPEAAEGCIALMGEHDLTFSRFLKLCAEGFGLFSEFENPEGHLRVLSAVLVERSRSGRASVVLIDQAERLSRRFIQELVEFSSWQRSGHRLCHVVLAARCDENGDVGPQFSGIPTAWRFELAPLRPGEMKSYLGLRFQAAGLEGDRVLSQAAVGAMAKLSKGLPGRINHLSDQLIELLPTMDLPVSEIALLRALAATSQVEETLASAGLAAGRSGRLSRLAGLKGMPLDLPRRRRRSVLKRWLRRRRQRLYWAGGALAATAVLASVFFVVRHSDSFSLRGLLPIGIDKGGAVALSGDEGPDRDLAQRRWPRAGGVAHSRAALRAVAAPGGEAELTAKTNWPPQTPGPQVSDAGPRRALLDADKVLGLRLQVLAAAGREDQAIPLKIEVTSTGEAEPQETRLSIAGLPTGALLSAGQRDETGVWSLVERDLPGLTLTPPPDFAGQLTLAVMADAHLSGVPSTQKAEILPVSVEGIADQPLLTVTAGRGREDEPLSLVLDLRGQDSDGSERLMLWIEGLPKGARLSAGALADAGRWLLTPEDLPGLTLTPAEDWSGEFDLTFVALSREADGDEAMTRTPLALSIAPQADPPSLEAGLSTAEEGPGLPLNIAVQPGDHDGSEELEIEVAGLPQGSELSAGRRTARGWLLRPGELSGLRLYLPKYFSGGLRPEVIARARDGQDGAEVSTRLALEIPSQFGEGMIEEMVRRGDELMGKKEVASARLFYQQAALRGYAAAMTALGNTYDPTVFKELGFREASADPAIARQWYLRGIAAGDKEAALRLEKLQAKYPAP